MIIREVRKAIVAGTWNRPIEGSKFSIVGKGQEEDDKGKEDLLFLMFVLSIGVLMLSCLVLDTVRFHAL